MRNTQQQVIQRLEKETLRSFDKIVAFGMNGVEKTWNKAKQRMEDAISKIYMDAFKSSTWNIVDATRMGLLRKIDMMVGAILSEYQEESVRSVSRVLREIYKDSVFHHAWMLDQVTPPSIKVKVPESPVLLEADNNVMIRTYKGPDSDTTWKVRWSAWQDAYRDALYQNLRLGALNESSLADARAEVNATRPGSPQSDMWDAFKRILEHQSEVSFVLAAMDVAVANPEMDVEEVWQTRYYDRVCEVCQDNEGLTRQETNEEIPAHPNCGCYWRLVPRTWASLLKRGSDEDKKLARAMDAHGEVPNSMMVFNNEGKLVGSVVVKFNEWIEDHEMSVRGGTR